MSDRWVLHFLTLTGGVLAALSGVGVAVALFPPSQWGAAEAPEAKAPPALHAVPASTPASAPATSQPASAPAQDPLGEPLGTFKVTVYVLTEETFFQDTGDGVPLYRTDGTVIGKFSPKFISDIKLQGSGRLATGEVITPAGKCSYGQGTCYQLLSTKKYPWGRGATGRALKIFQSVAVDPKVIPYGTKIYVPELDGHVWNGKKFDGCLSADDTGGSIKGKKLDIFVGTRKAVNSAAKLFGSKGTAVVYDGSVRCNKEKSDKKVQ